MPLTLFISYARGDGSDFAESLYQNLRQAGHTVWYDKNSITPGERFYDAIATGLKKAQALLLVMTPGAVASDQVTGEWNEALNRYIPILPLMATECDPLYILKIFQFIDFRTKDDKAWTKLHLKLQNLPAAHRQFLHQRLAELKAAQEKAALPDSFQYKIEDVGEVIRAWEERFGTQTEHLTAEMDTHREQILASQQLRLQGREKKFLIGDNLSNVVENFMDRTDEQRRLGELLSDKAIHLITIIGRGGIGKTALAHKVLNDLAHGRWPATPQPVDGIIHLSALKNPITLEKIYLNIAEFLGGSQQAQLTETWTDARIPPDKKITQLLNTIKGLTLVVFIDNIEDLLDENRLIEDESLRLFFESNLTYIDHVRLMVTSRIPIKLPREVYHLDQQINLVEGLPQEEGIAFLRALDPNNQCGLRNAPQEELVEIWKMVHGVPRALQLVANILREDVRFPTLQEVRETYFHHPDVIQGLIEDNYKRLDQPSRRVIEALAIFGSPVPLVAVKYLLSPLYPGMPVEAIVANLTQTSMVRIDRADKTFSLHPIERDYIYSQLPLEGEFSRLFFEQKAAEYYAQMRLAEWKTPDDALFHIRQFEHLVKAQNYEQALYLLAELEPPLTAWGHIQQVEQMGRSLMPYLQLPLQKVK
jgi:hypothetical protein